MLNSASLKRINFRNKIIDIYDRLEQAGIIHWPVLAAALSYYCILGLVPFLALCFTMAKSFGLEADLAEAINHYFDFTTSDAQEQVVLRLKGFADNLISNYSGSVMAFVALGLIFWSGYRILMLLEGAFGDIFGFHPPRRTIHRVMDYFTVMVIVPLLLIAAVAINIFLTGLANSAWTIPWGLDPSNFISVIIVAFPFLMWWLILAWAYSYFSRGLIRWKERLIGGFFTGVVFQLFQSFYLKVMFALSSYNAIYGSFAAVPLLMIWLYAGWHIVLGGGELTRRFSDLFVTGQGFFSLLTPATWLGTCTLANLVLLEVIKNYSAEPIGRPSSFRQLSRDIGAPMQALGRVISRLLNVELLVRVSGPYLDDGPCFLPTHNSTQLTREYIDKTLEKGLLFIF